MLLDSKAPWEWVSDVIKDDVYQPLVSDGTEAEIAFGEFRDGKSGEDVKDSFKQRAD